VKVALVLLGVAGIAVVFFLLHRRKIVLAAGVTGGVGSGAPGVVTGPGGVITTPDGGTVWSGKPPPVQGKVPAPVVTMPTTPPPPPAPSPAAKVGLSGGTGVRL